MTDYKICVILIKETNWFDEPIMYYIFKGVPTNMSRPFEKILVDWDSQLHFFVLWHSKGMQVFMMQ